jgi:nitrogen fixation NifU-like protein
MNDNNQNFYNKMVMDHFSSPHNYGKMENPDGIGEVGNLVCGDVMRLYIKVKTVDDRDIISDISFETYGCAAAIATSSMITDLARGKTIENALKIENANVANSLKGLPPIKMHCSVLASEALKEAVFDYLTKNKKEIPEFLKEIHLKLQRIKVELEKRYKPWIEAEKENL